MNLIWFKFEIPLVQIYTGSRYTREFSDVDQIYLILFKVDILI